MATSKNFQAFTGNGDVSKWMKILQWDVKLQANKRTVYVDPKGNRTRTVLFLKFYTV